MIDIDHEDNSCHIVGDSVSELIDECLKRIRPQSKEFYKKELKRDLENYGASRIDRHAGMGTYYRVLLRKEHKQSKIREEALTELTKQAQQLGLDY